MLANPNESGLTLLYLFKDPPSKTYFTVLNKTNSDLHVLVKTTSSVVLLSYFTDTMIMISPRYGAKRAISVCAIATIVAT